ncbi:MAG: gluconate 2-dehydrogenase subunit 3 family protein [Ginsengibacter sp.]
MDRRKSLKAIALGTVSTGLLLDACKTADKKVTPEISATTDLKYDRTPEEREAYKKLMSEKFFDKHEMATIAVVCDIIIPADEVSGSATQAKVPEFIEFIVKDKPQNQTPMRGGLRWLDMQSNKNFEKPFIDCSNKEQLSIIDQIAYPKKAKADMQQGVAFFNLMRNLTATGFYTSEMGIKDIGYKGNTPNQWAGVPDDILKQYNLAYTEKELKECV